MITRSAVISADAVTTRTHTLSKIDAPTLCALACYAGVDLQLL